MKYVLWFPFGCFTVSVSISSENLVVLQILVDIYFTGIPNFIIWSCFGHKFIKSRLWKHRKGYNLFNRNVKDLLT